jgi:hypothetical protein
MVEKTRRVGLIVNPCAGRGAEENLLTARRAIVALSPEVIVTAPGELGGAALSGWTGDRTSPHTYSRSQVAAGGFCPECPGLCGACRGTRRFRHGLHHRARHPAPICDLALITSSCASLRKL